MIARGLTAAPTSDVVSEAAGAAAAGEDRVSTARTSLRRALGTLAGALMWLVILGSVAVLAVTVVVPRLAGATPYTVLTGSMEPTMPPGTLVVVRPVDPETIGVGQVVTYQLESGEPTVVTHRVVAVAVDGAGELRLTTQGDANDVPDAAPVRPVQVRGVVWYDVPQLGRLSQLLSGRERHLGVTLVALALLGYALRMLAGAAADRRRAVR